MLPLSQCLTFRSLPNAKRIKTSAGDKWRAPQARQIKVHFDGAFDAKVSRGGYGIIARDADGCFLGACAGKLVHVADPFSIKAVAVRVVEWAREMGFTRIVVKGDALRIIKGINNPNPDLSPIGAYIEEAKLAKRYQQRVGSGGKRPVPA